MGASGLEVGGAYTTGRTKLAAHRRQDLFVRDPRDSATQEYPGPKNIRDPRNKTTRWGTPGRNGEWLEADLNRRPYGYEPYALTN